MKRTRVLLPVVVWAVLMQPGLAVPERVNQGPLFAAQSPSPIVQRPSVDTPRGRVRLVGRVLHDDDGPMVGLGATLFWGVWGYAHDRARLVQQFDLLRSRGFEFVRVLGVVTGSSWDDRMADPRDPGYDATIAGLTDLAFAHGLRVGWTIFGDTLAAPTPSQRVAIVDRFAAMAKGREQKILYVEIANEGWQNGFGARLGELQELGRRLKARTPVLVALTSPQLPLRCAVMTSIYGPGAADVISLHFDRNIGAPDGRWGPVREIVKWPSLSASCGGTLPAAAANNEPIGPQSSVASEEDPLHILAAAAVTYVSGLPIYILHSGAGVRGGGRADRVLGRAASFSDLPHAGELLQGFAALKRYLPPDLSGWDRFDVATPNGPVRIEAGTGARFDAAAARQGGRFVVVPFGIRPPLTISAPARVEIDVLNPATGARIIRQTLGPGDRIQLPSVLEALVLVGRVL